MLRPPSPCIDVCKHKLRGHCIGCGMTKAQKELVKRLDGAEERRAFIVMLIDQQRRLGGRFAGWEIAYRRKCAKKGKPCLLDELAQAPQPAAE
ncbi:MAG: DUF1289 domain-containing protein [Rubrimonas sp.]|uniref:DUF1289 domain-containing protein n=1 Tax=Rubrimonas sp. TaxID=2036015 RepID=UPI002FDCAE08